jgi:hypothetical protein
MRRGNIFIAWLTLTPIGLAVVRCTMDHFKNDPLIAKDRPTWFGITAS